MRTVNWTYGVTFVLVAVVTFGAPAKADHLGFQHSNNCVRQSVPIDTFKEDDIGTLVDLVYSECGSTETTTLFNGIYRRVSNQPNPNPAAATAPVPSAGDARKDMVVYDSAYSAGNLPGNQPCENSGGITGNIAVSPACIQAQIGVAFNPQITLKANVTISGNVVTVKDTTGAPGPFPAGQLVDAGPGLGGMECVMMIKNGTPKLADIVCDMDEWYEDASHNVQYGIRDYNFGQPVNRLLIFWLMGPNPTGSMAVTNSFCSAVLAGGAVPARNFADGSLALQEDASDYALGDSVLREEWSMAASTAYIQLYGEHPTAYNLISCLGTATYCDNGELPPDADSGRLSGNSCTEAAGAAAPADFRVTNTVPFNASMTQGGAFGSGGSTLTCTAELQAAGACTP